MGFSDGTESSTSNADVAAANTNRTLTMAGTSTAIFTFLFGFFYPRYASGEIDPVLFQIALAVIGFAIFSFIFSGMYYYELTLAQSETKERRERFRRRADSLWLVGFSLLFLDPSLMLLTVGLVSVGVLWLVLWIVYLLFMMNLYRETQVWSRQAL